MHTRTIESFYMGTHVRAESLDMGHPRIPLPIFNNRVGSAARSRERGIPKDTRPKSSRPPRRPRGGHLKWARFNAKTQTGSHSAQRTHARTHALRLLKEAEPTGGERKLRAVARSRQSGRGSARLGFVIYFSSLWRSTSRASRPLSVTYCTLKGQVEPFFQSFTSASGLQ